MANTKNSSQDQQPNQQEPPRPETPSSEIALQPAGEWFAEFAQDYPQLPQQYAALSRKDLHLAELYRQVTTDSPAPLNPVQAAVDPQGVAWIDVLAEIKLDRSPESQLEAEQQIKKLLDGVMEVHAVLGPRISGRIQSGNLPQLEKLASRIQAARPIAATIDRSLRAMQADQPAIAQTFPGQPLIDGRRVIVGIVDLEGCDFNHQSFLDAQGNSRLLSLWDQTKNAGAGENAPQPYNYGRHFNRQRLNQALQAEDPYANLGYTPQDAAHGTHVMDIAAGSGKWPGVAPGAELVFVHLGLPAEIDVEEQTFGASTRLIDAVKYVFDIAGSQVPPMPAVVNISLGTNGGAHDGASLAETMFDDLLQGVTGRAIVISAGNSYKTNIHCMGGVPPQGQVTLNWFIESRAPANWGQRQEMEIWYSRQASLVVDVFTPNNEFLGSCALGQTMLGRPAQGSEPTLVIHHIAPDNDDENHINIFLDDRYPNLQLGAWRFRLRHANPAAAQVEAVYHAWIELNKRYPSHFSAGSCNPDYTLNSIANAELPIVVGACYPDAVGQPVTDFSSAGPSRNPANQQKPDLCAPGQNIYAAWALHTGGTVESGTSMAAPHVTGLLALMFQAARDRLVPAQSLSIGQLRTILTNTADNENAPPGGNVYDTRYGFGRANGVAALTKILG